MLLQLEKKAKVTKEVRILPLPKGESGVKPGTVCQVAGWGQLAIDGKPSNTLHEVEMTVQQDKVCKKHFRNYNSATQICAGDPNTQKGPFKDYSGGPFLCVNVIQGVTSCRGEEDEPNPAIFTKFSTFVAWIKEIINKT